MIAPVTVAMVSIQLMASCQLLLRLWGKGESIEPILMPVVITLADSLSIVFMKTPPSPAKKPKEVTARLHESVDMIVETIATDCFPEKSTIKKMGINDIKRWALLLSKEGKLKLFNALSDQQKQFVPPGLLK